MGHRCNRAPDKRGQALLRRRARRMVTARDWVVNRWFTKHRSCHQRPWHAIDQRRPTNSTVIHSDQGTQFTSWAFTRRAVDSGLLPSMGSVGDCFDNAVMEAFWSRMQVELLDRRRWSTRDPPIQGLGQKFHLCKFRHLAAMTYHG